MSVTINGITPGSYADKKGIKAGEELISVNGNLIEDGLDFRFYTTAKKLSLVIRGTEGAERTVALRKHDEYDDLGMEFDTFLMDEHRSCRNGCIFCFIDQNPPGMRKSIYFKDDDARLSFLLGNYITLTNLSEHDVERIIQMKISPLRISVHATEPELRCRMMRNRFAGSALELMKRFAAAGIQMECQIVLCRGYNDGEHLKRSLDDLLSLYPQVDSIAVVPAGLTAYRQKLTKLEPFSREESAGVLHFLVEYGDACRSMCGRRLVYPSDEWFLNAGEPLPGDEFYEEYAQLDNGVGLISSMRSEFESAYRFVEESDEERHLSLATGEAAGPFITSLVDLLKLKWHNLKCEVTVVKNRFFGGQVNVAGLVTGGDLLDALDGKDIGEELLIPSVMLRHERDLFLDGISLEEVEERLGVPVRLVENDGAEFIDAVLGI